MLNRKAPELDLCDLTPTVSPPSCHPAFPRPGAAQGGDTCGAQCRGPGGHGVTGWQMKPGLEGAVATELAGPPICPALAQRAREEERRRMVLTCAPSLQSHLLSLDLSHVLLSPSSPKLCLWWLQSARGSLGTA